MVAISAPISSAAESSLTVCADAALSGPFASLGQGEVNGAKAYVKMIDAKGGILGHQVKFVVEDDQSVPSTAATLARKCVEQEHANFVLGPEETSTSSAAIPVLNALDEVTISWQSGWNDIGLSEANRHEYVFPGQENVFHEDDLATVQEIVAPRHYKRIAVIEDSAPGGLGNNTYTASLSKQYGGFQVVKNETVSPGATDDTPSVLALLAAKPQLIMLGTIPGPDTITAIKSIRAQNPTIPVSLCSGCELPSFVAAAGGPNAMKDVYVLGAQSQLATALKPTAANKPTIADASAYIAAMKADGFTSANQIDDGPEGWASFEDLTAAIETAKSTSASAVKTALEHQTIDTLGIHWARTPQNYGLLTGYQSVVNVVQPSGALKVFGTPPGGPGE
jgi:branched-chain amino acid transport system substrate-binding protein